MKKAVPASMPISESDRLPFPGKGRAGYTLLEVVVVVAILATALSLATPSFIRMIEQQRVQSVIHSVNIGLTDLRLSSQTEARAIRAAEAEAYLARDLPLGWYVSVGETVEFSAAGACQGGGLRLTTPDDREYAFDLAHRTCLIEGRSGR